MGRRPLKTFTRTISHFINLRDNRYRCLDLTDSRRTTAARSTPITRAGGRLPCRPTKSCGYRQGEPSPYLVSRVLLVELDFRSLVTLAEYEQGPSTPVTSVVPSLSFPTIYLSRAPLGRPTFLPLRTPVDSGSYHQVKPGGITLDGTLKEVRQRHPRDELKR